MFFLWKYPRMGNDGMPMYKYAIQFKRQNIIEAFSFIYCASLTTLLQLFKISKLTQEWIKSLPKPE